MSDPRDKKDWACPMVYYEQCPHIKRQRSIIKDLKKIIRDLKQNE